MGHVYLSKNDPRFHFGNRLGGTESLRVYMCRVLPGFLAGLGAGFSTAPPFQNEATFVADEST